MRRRTFLQTAAAALAANGAALAAAPMPMKKLGRSGLNVSRFCLGGYHMGRRDAQTGVAIIHRALDLGINFFDSAHHYNKGLSDEISKLLQKADISVPGKEDHSKRALDALSIFNRVVQMWSDDL